MKQISKLTFFLATFLVLIPGTFAFNLTSGDEEDLCTAPKYSGSTYLVGSFVNNKFLFGNHAKYEFRPATGEDEKLPLYQEYPNLNQILQLNFFSNQTSQLKENIISKIKVQNYQAYCEGLPSIDYIIEDTTFKNTYSGLSLFSGNPETEKGPIIFKGEQTITGTLKSPFVINGTSFEYGLEVLEKDQHILPLSAKKIKDPTFNSQVKISDYKYLQDFLKQNKDQQIKLTISEYGFEDSTPYIKIKTNFLDITEDNPYKNDIQKLKDVGIIGGYEDGTFKSENLMNRAEFSKIALKYKLTDDDIESWQKNCFEDVKAEHWFSSFVCIAKDAGIVEGFEGKVFYPERYISLAEVLKITMKINGIEYEETEVWYEGIMEKADELGLLDFGVNDFNTQITRGQMAHIMAKLLP